MCMHLLVVTTNIKIVATIALPHNYYDTVHFKLNREKLKYTEDRNLELQDEVPIHSMASSMLLFI